MDRALLVGINEYPAAPLAGCLNDIANVQKELLIEWFQFNLSDIHVLLNRDATTKNILKECAWLAGASPGSRAYFHYSGHGARNPSPTNPDRNDEVICPVDFDWTYEHMITDEQFVRIFASMPKGVKFNWASDSCHSGGLSREMDRTRNPVKKTPKHFPAPLHILEEIQKRRSRPKHVHNRGVKGLVAGVLDVGYISGCRSDQTSADTEINGHPCGAFTHYYLETLRNERSKPLIQVVPDIVKALAANEYDQVPEGDGARVSIPIFG